VENIIVLADSKLNHHFQQPPVSKTGVPFLEVVVATKTYNGPPKTLPPSLPPATKDIAELREIVANWAQLPSPIRMALLTIVRATTASR
jgi:hypothetical protein